MSEKNNSDQIMHAKPVQQEIQDNQGKQEKQGLAIFLCVMTTIFWGSTFILTKKTTEVLPPLFYISVRYLISGLSFIPLFKRFKGIDFHKVKISFIAAFIYWVSNVTQTLGLQTSTASKSSFITVLNVIFVPIILAIFFKEKVSRNLWIGVILAILGTGVLSFVGDGQLNGIALGDVLTLICAIAYAVYIIYLDKHLHEIDLILFSCLQMFFVSILSIGPSLILEDWSVLFSGGFSNVFSTDVILVLLYMGIIATSGSILTQIYGQKYTTASKAAIIFSLEPVFATSFGILLGGEILTMSMLIGSAFILVGVVIAQIKSKEKVEKVETND